MSYILVVEDEADIRDIFEMILKRVFSVDVVLAESGNKALSFIKEKGAPLVVISDYRMPDGDGFFLYQALKTSYSKVPFVICSTDASQLRSRFPDITGFIEKPNVINPVVEIVEKILGINLVSPIYVPIRISLLLRRGTAPYDLFMKLSDAKFVKVLNAGEAFIPSDADRFNQKGLQHLYITSEDSESYLKAFQENLKMVIESDKPASSELAVMSLESLEAVERIGSALGWTPPVLEAAKHAVHLAVKAVSRDASILKLFKQKLKDPSSKYSGHTSLLALLSCGICHTLGWTSESTQMKLGLAALMHDLTVDESAYNEIFVWNDAASDSQVKTPEVIKYRNHPADAANLLLTMKSVPADVDQIILQHHEKKDGSGFPRGLISSRISPMACIFIIVEDLINFIEDSTDFEAKVQLFLKQRELRYNSGNFKKVFEAFKESVEKSRAHGH